jgi:hypothetical protein
MEISEPIVACIADLAFKYTGFFFYHTKVPVSKLITVIIYLFFLNFVSLVESVIFSHFMKFNSIFLHSLH